LDHEQPPPAAFPSDRFCGFEPRRDWHLEDLLDDAHNIPGCELTETEIHWIRAWDDFVGILREAMQFRPVPGHPIWAETWLDFTEIRSLRWDRPGPIATPKELTVPSIDPTVPGWKQTIIAKNHDLFRRHYEALVPWARHWGVFTDLFPSSRRKLEWQAQDTKSLWDTVMHLRPSGIRAKAPTYLPALVAMNQTSIIGPRGRRVSPREAARLQGLPDSFEFIDQPASSTYRQLGNGVHVGVVWHILRRHVRRDLEILSTSPQGRRIAEAVRKSPDSPVSILARHEPAGATTWAGSA
jgi:DNA (cytosine-5)-methyltransferase 1